MKKSPLQQVQDRFKSKEKLIEAVRKLATDDLWLDRVNESKGLEHISNAKLLHLHDVLAEVKKEFGSRKKLVDALVAAEKRQKDEGYRARLESWPTPRRLDRYRAIN